MSTPFTYLIGWSAMNLFYYGVRYRTGCHPDDLLTTYFTSSKLVHQCIIDHGMPDIVEIRRVFKLPKKALLWEQKVLRRLRVLYNSKWLNKNASGAIEFDERIRKLMSEAKRGCVWVHKNGRKTLIRKELLSSYLNDGYRRGHGQKNNGIANGMYGKRHSIQTREKISSARKGVNTNTDEHRARKSASMLINNPMHDASTRAKHLKACQDRKSGKPVFFENMQYKNVREANAKFPHIKYSTLTYWCTHKKNGWSYEPPISSPL